MISKAKVSEYISEPLRMIPIGAYVRFSEIDEEGKAVDSKDPDLLLNQPRIKRLLVALAGPAMNLCLGILIFLVMFWVTGFTTTHITKPEKGSQLAAYAEMVNDGDTIKAVNGVNVYSSFDLVFEMDSADPSKEMDLKIKSKETGKNYTVTLTPVVRARPMLLITVENKLANNDYKGWKVYSVSEEQNNGKPVIKPGDYITHINGKSVDDEDFEDFLYNITDDIVTVTYVRDGETRVDDLVPKYVDTVNSRGVTLLQYRINSVSRFYRNHNYGQ